MTPLRQKMIEDMQLRGMSEITQDRYVRAVRQLADHYGVDRSALENSVSRYNEFQKQRQDVDFGKPILADSRPIEAPPFYAARIWPKVHHTMGFSRIDAKTRVLDLEGQPIPKLFAAGEVTGGVHGACRLGGNAITECLYFGRVAGRMASTLSNENAV